MRVLLLTPPMTQVNTPYPATAYLTGFLRSHGVDAHQRDPALELFLRLFSERGVRGMAEALRSSKRGSDSEAVSFFLRHVEEYATSIEPVIEFLQGKNPTLAIRIIGRDFLPEGPQFRALEQWKEVGPSEDPLSWAFGALGIQDQAKHIASLFVDDLAIVIRDGIDSRFGLSRYAEKLAASTPSFAPIEEALRATPTLVDSTLDEISRELWQAHRPEVLGLTVPFPGNAYGAFRIAKVFKDLDPGIRVVLGGGYVNTELRSLREPRVFDYVDFVTLDDGEKPLLCLLEHLEGKRTSDELLRTFVRVKDEVVLKSSLKEHDIPHKDIGAPSYDGLPLKQYVSLFEMLNPMHRIWSDGRWNKLSVAHGCYWRKCNFCDLTLDYINRYDPASADLIVDRIENVLAQTGERGFHFVDEAAPPTVLKAMAQRLLDRKVTISWWGNIRFDKTFTPEVTRLLARSGCVAVSGGLEVASDRLLQLMKKGVTVEQVARVTKAFTDAGIMVHAYLMYGFPTQTVQETVDALERVRQLFAAGCIQSAYWHRFSATAHSPIGKNPEAFGIRLLPQPEATFAVNDLAFVDPTGVDHDWLGEGLKKALYNYMLGLGLETDVRYWFSSSEAEQPRAKAGRGKSSKRSAMKKVPKAQVAPDLIARALS